MEKEHQVKIWANEFNPIGFGIIHKQQALDMFSDELIAAYIKLGKDLKKKTHKYFWELKENQIRINHFIQEKMMILFQYQLGVCISIHGQK